LKIINVVKRNIFLDSIQILHISEEVKKLPGVIDAAIVMGTDLNKELLEKEGLLLDEGRKAHPNDIIIAVKIVDESYKDKVLSEIEKMLSVIPKAEETYYSIDDALAVLRDANIAVVSVPGQYARDTVIKLLEKDIHVFLFSDHVPLEHEIELKKMAIEKGLLLMGPEAGTSIINGVGLGFANAVNRGPIGVVAAAGTGLQEFTVLVTLGESGISQAIGVGSRDLSEAVNGLMTLQALTALEEDSETQVIALISKPPALSVQKRIIKYIIEKGRKKYVTCFIGGKEFDVPNSSKGRIIQTFTLHAAALEALRLVSKDLYERAYERFTLSKEEILRIAEKEFNRLDSRQKYIRGLYTGGTFTYEALVLLDFLIGNVYSNTPLKKEFALRNPWRSFKHTIVDLGAEEFTAGRAHPMIDPTIRLQRILDEAKDPEIAVILLDFVLGYGAHHNPATAHVEYIKRAKKIAEEDGRYLVVVAHICGIDKDPQNAAKQEEILKGAGVITLPTNAMAVLVSAIIANRGIANNKLDAFYEYYLARH